MKEKNIFFLINRAWKLFRELGFKNLSEEQREIFIHSAHILTNPKTEEGNVIELSKAEQVFAKHLYLAIGAAYDELARGIK